MHLVFFCIDASVEISSGASWNNDVFAFWHTRELLYIFEWNRPYCHFSDTAFASILWWIVPLVFSHRFQTCLKPQFLKWGSKFQPHHAVLLDLPFLEVLLKGAAVSKDCHLLCHQNLWCCLLLTIMNLCPTSSCISAEYQNNSKLMVRATAIYMILIVLLIVRSVHDECD
jgi:hypothetical protein